MNTQIADYMLSLYPEFDDYNTLEKYFEENCHISGEYFLSEFRRDCRREFPENEEERDAFSEVVSILSENNLRFAEYFAQFIAEGYSSILAVAKQTGICVSPYALTADIVCQIYASLYNIAIRPLVFELDAAKKNGILVGDTPDERFNYFAEVLLTDSEYVSTLHSEYKLMYSNLCAAADQTAEFVAEILRNTASDMELLRRDISGGKQTGALINITLSGGDSHSGCRSVSILRFENAKLVYKPHSLIGESAFCKLMDFTNSFSQDEYSLRCMKIIDREDYGWAEFIEHLPLENAEDAPVFYRKTGRLMALLYLCGASDMHFENIIACGTDPVPIDMETIFHCVPFELHNPDDKDSGYVSMKRFLNSSVHGIGLLPSYVNFRDGSGKQKQLSVGGMAGSAAQESPFTSYSFDNMGKDNVNMVRESFNIESSDNSPLLNGEELDPHPYTEDIARGFEEVYRIILNNKEAFIGYITGLFKNTRNRIVLKATLAYGNLLSIATHPDFQRSEVFARLLFSRIGLLKPSSEVLSYEIDALIHRSIPIYYADFEKRSLTGGDGTIFEDILDRSPKDEFLIKIGGFSERDLKIQTDMIRTSYFVIDGSKDHTAIDFHDASKGCADNSRLLETAMEIGDYLLNYRSVTGINHKGVTDRFFYGCSVERCENDDFTTCMNDFYLYDGSCGIALFLHELGRISGEKRFTDAAYEAIEPIVCIIESDTFNFEHRAGAFTGAAGYFYILNKFAELDDNEKLRILIKERLYRVTEFAHQEGTAAADIIAGISGAVAVLVNIAESTSDSELAAIALTEAEKCFALMYDATTKDGSLDADNLGYSGFAHGIAGTIPYVYRLSMLSGREDILRYAESLIAFERENFRIEEDGRIIGWLSSKENGGIVSSWCHGTPGFLLEKLLLKKWGYSDNELERELHSAAEIVVEDCIGTSLSYCHGDMGNLSILKMYAQLCGDEALEERCSSTFADLYNSCIRNVIFSSDMMCHKYNGLMIGLSGIGYSCLQELDSSLTHFIMLA